MNEAAETTVPRARPLALAASPDTLFRIGVGALTAVVAAFLFARLTVWPPHEDETLALFAGRGSVGQLIRTVLGERGGAPLHFLFAWVITHTGGGLVELRLVSTFFAVASVPLIALLVHRLTDRATALVATAIVVPSWMLLFHGIYGRMYSIFLFTATLSYIALLRALERRDRRHWLLWGLAMLVCIATHPYGALVLASQGLYVLCIRRLREGVLPFAAVFVLAIPFWHSDTVLANRFDVGVGGGGTKLGSPFAILKYLARVAGDFTVGWLAVRVVVLLLALAGLVLLARTWRRSAVFVACVLVTPFLFFAATRIGSGMASPESRHLIFVLPFFALLVALPLVRIARNRYGVVLVAVALVALGAGEVAWGMHNTRTLYVGEAALRTSSREAASTWLASTSRPSDILFGYDPVFLGAWEQNRSFSDVVVPRADTKLALHVLYQQPKPLGRGLWVLDASDNNNFTPRLHIPLRYPRPASKFDARVFGPFLVIRSRKPTGTIREFLLETQAVQLVGQSLYLGDSDINLLTVERALGLRGLDAGGPR
ncbi:MAG TPA: glycosyltransferase family 39 protein [Polyangiaceae bacterium]|nr:glycosyltransferase family 39 protein [Polyangiaceae bacterium]